MEQVRYFVKSVAFVITVAVLLAGLTLMASNWNEGIADKKCKTSVGIHMKSQVSFLSVTQAILKVEKDSVSYNAIDCPTKEPTLSKKDEEAKFELAEEMRKCWDDFHEGKEPLFTDEGLFCHVCTIADFKDKYGTLENFGDYLAKTKVPNHQYTYTEFLTNQQSKTGASINEELAKEIREASLDKQNDYAVVYVYARGEDAIEEFQKYLNTDAGNTVLVSGVIGGAAVIVMLTPVGWVGTGIAAGVAAISFTVSWIADYFVAQDVQYASFISLEEYNAENLNKVCDIMPIRAITR